MQIYRDSCLNQVGLGLQSLQKNQDDQFITVPAHANGLAVSGSVIYAGGDFTLAGGLLANRIATWNGTSWAPLGSGADDLVWAVALTSDYLYIGGDFKAAGGTPAYGIARWKR